MIKEFTLITICFFFNALIAQPNNEKTIIVQKFYDDTLKTDYSKVKFEINQKADRVIRMDYSSSHISDTITVRKIDEYKYENGSFIWPGYKKSKDLNIEKYEVGDTIFENKTDYLTKKIYKKNQLIYAARVFPKESLVPYNERIYYYDKSGNLIKIEEKYNCSIHCENYRTKFDYTSGIVSRMTEFKLIDNNWRKQKVWEYDLLTKNKIDNKIKKRINVLLLGNQFLRTPW